MKQFAKRSIAIGVVATLILLTVLLSGCWGYNRIMRQHLSDPNNYNEYVFEVNRFYCYNDAHADYEERFTDIICANDINIDKMQCVFVEPIFTNQNGEKIVGSRFEILKSNISHLLSTDFFDVVKKGDSIVVRATRWIYMDGEFDYIAEISLNGETYLSFDEGLKNIVDYMNANKSLF